MEGYNNNNNNQSFVLTAAIRKCDFLHVSVCTRRVVRKGDPQQQVLWELNLEDNYTI